MPSFSAFKDGLSSSSRRFSGGGGQNKYHSEKMHEMNHYMSSGGGGGGNEYEMRKRVMVVVDQSSSSKQAMMWALTHLTNRGDSLTLLHIVPLNGSSDYYASYLAKSLGSLCKASKPEVEVEALVIQGDRLETVMSQVKKLEVSVLVLGQNKPSSIFFSCFAGNKDEDFVDQCIKNAECLTLGVRKQRRGMGGYLVSSRWQKDFWLLA